MAYKVRNFTNKFAWQTSYLIQMGDRCFLNSDQSKILMFLL
ncbi:hypothetical protein M272_21105 [Vibrio natriegens NBRC 15636 = ATCC 14048 = DSM 759]|nr:hypothetical protein M272_21105 [Vibrio natriegens NBRC 15636 = ATCC 14048 = DSM 759]